MPTSFPPPQIDQELMNQQMKKATDIMEGKGFIGFLLKLTKPLNRIFFGKRMANQFDVLQQNSLQMMNGLQQQQAILANGEDATGTVLELSATGSSLNQCLIVNLRVRVTPKSGSEYETTQNLPISPVQMPRVGDKIRLKIDPQNRDQVAYLGICIPESVVAR